METEGIGRIIRPWIDDTAGFFGRAAKSRWVRRGAVAGVAGGGGGYGAYRYRQRSSGRNGLQPRSSGAAANMQNMGSM